MFQSDAILQHAIYRLQVSQSDFMQFVAQADQGREVVAAVAVSGQRRIEGGTLCGRTVSR